MNKPAISEDEQKRIAERVARLSTHSAGEVWTPDDQVFGKPELPMTRELWLRTRALDLSLAIHLHITFGFTDAPLQNWIDELQDLWQLIADNGRIS